MIGPDRDPSDGPAPAFRALEVHPLDAGPRRGVVLSDPLGLFEGQVFVPAGLMPIVERIDGRRSIATIESELRSSGFEVPDGLVHDVVRDFDEALLLHGELFETTLERTVEAFLGADARPPRHAGTAGYPADPEDCADALDALLGGSGIQATSNPTDLPPRGVISPHVDLARGAQVYGNVWRQVAARPLADLYVVLGTGHHGPPRPLTGLGLHWDTPRGRLQTDSDFVVAVHRRLGAPTPLEQFLHREEHSIEFQMLWLAHLAAARPTAARPRVAAFLCGNLPPSAADRVVAALRAAADEVAGRVCFVAGADLAHLGPLFGDDDPVDGAATREALAARDAVRLAPLRAGDPLGFRATIDRDDNADRVCSVTALQLVSALAGPASGPLAYGQTPTSPEQVVSFAGGLLG